MKPFELSSHTTMPAIGFGLWQNRDRQECLDSIAEALKVGYRHFDTAQAYGNEAYTGEALRASGLPRSEVFITTKIWNQNQPADKLLPSFEQSLKDLQTDYVDLLLLHFPVTQTRRAAWPIMERIAASGRAKAVGVSNYTIKHLEELLASYNIKPAVNQVELHVYLQQPELVKYCADNDILVEAYSPIAHGHGLDNPALAEIGTKHGKTATQVMIQWCLEVGTVPLPKSVKPERIAANYNVFDFALDADDMAQLATLDQDMHTSWDPTDVE